MLCNFFNLKSIKKQKISNNSSINKTSLVCGRGLTKPEILGKISVFTSLYFAKLTFSEIEYQKSETTLFPALATPHPFSMAKSD